MQRFSVGLVLLYLSATPPALAETEQYDDCILDYLQNAKLDLTTDMIKQACNEIHQLAGVAAMNRRPYNQCLLQHLGGVENVRAALDIKAACGRRHL